MARISFTPNLTRVTECPDLDLSAKSIAELFDLYFAQWPDVRSYVLDDQGAIRKHIIVLVDGFNMRDRTMLTDPLQTDSEVFIFQALSGG